MSPWKQFVCKPKLTQEERLGLVVVTLFVFVSIFTL